MLPCGWRQYVGTILRTGPLLRLLFRLIEALLGSGFVIGGNCWQAAVVVQAGFCWGKLWSGFWNFGWESFPGFLCVLFQVPPGPSLLLGGSTSEEWELVARLNRKGPLRWMMGTQVQKYTRPALGHRGSAGGMEVLVPGTVTDAHPPQSGRHRGGVVNTDLCPSSYISLGDHGTFLSFRVLTFCHSLNRQYTCVYQNLKKYRRCSLRQHVY